MPTKTVYVGNYVARWRSPASHIAVWRAERAGEQVPDHMVTIPEQVNRFRATSEDVERLVREFLQ